MCNTLGNIFRACIVGGVGLALFMEFLVSFSCDFLTTPSGNVGIWYIEVNGECVEWTSSDELVIGAQSALTLSMIAGFAAGVMVLFEWCLCEVCCAGCLEGLAFCCAWLFAGSVFMIYGIESCADDQCEWGPDATYMTVASAAFLCCGILLCCTPQPEPLCKQ